MTVPLSLDRPYWIESADLDIEFHVRHIALPHPGDWRQLMIQVARIHSRPLDRSRPLWEAYVIEGLDKIPGLPKGSFAVFSKIHHAVIDGAGRRRDAEDDAFADAGDPPRAQAAAGRAPERKPQDAELLALAVVNNLVAGEAPRRADARRRRQRRAHGDGRASPGCASRRRRAPPMRPAPA